MKFQEIDKEDQSNIIQILKSNTTLAIELLKGFNVSLWEIVKLKRKHDLRLCNGEAFKSGMTCENESSLKKCIVCDHTEFECSVLDVTAGHVCEQEFSCKKCGHVTYWGFGYLDINGDL